MDRAQDVAYDRWLEYGTTWGPVTIWQGDKVVMDSNEIALLDLSALTD